MGPYSLARPVQNESDDVVDSLWVVGKMNVQLLVPGGEQSSLFWDLLNS